jgi:putative membrane-bound dehydrogenase-like protein
LKPATVTSAEILWEMRKEWYHYKIETSTDGKQWSMAHDGSKNTRRSDTKDRFEAKNIRFLRVTTLGQETDKWPAFWEIRLTGPKEPLKLFPVLSEAEKARTGMSDEFKKSGNIKPTIPKLTPAEEQAILKDVQVPEGFEVSLFANWQTANYPVYVAASPGGDLYVSSDGNGSLGRDPKRGRVLRLRDTDKDGRADEVTEFIPDIDSPRGLIWDHDRLYLLHPPHISVFFDRDHDGVAEESKRLISDIAFGFKDRPADHTTNGLEMGIDGWIYIAGGDFGFMKATGTDGRTLQHRGGGVIRFRPDGSGLELYSTGTRNILATPMSPTLDLFARDNTNDGGGWDVRFHYFTPLSDHGYPRLYKNFEKEHIQPLADYGGGSGCGGVYLHEPGFPDEWNKAPFTCDWGKAGLFRHSVEPNGATFKETTAPQRFIKVTRPTDADVDGMSTVYQASWKGPATFGWKGPNQGYIVRVTPKGYTPKPLPDFEKMSDEDLVTALESPSHVRTLAAQRAIIRREFTQQMRDGLRELVSKQGAATSARVAAIYALVQSRPEEGFSLLSMAKHSPDIEPFLIKAYADSPDSGFSGSFALIDEAMKQGNPRTILEGIFTLTKGHPNNALSMAAPIIARHLASKDPVIRHTAYRALAKMSAHEAAFAWIDNDDIDIRKAAAWALMRMHKPEVVNELISRLSSEKDLAKRRPLLSILARLYHKEAEWKGDSWGTRPDTRGPYYQLATWEQSDRIVKTLKGILKDAPPEEAAFIIKKLNKNRIPASDALGKLIDLALKDDKLIPDALKQLAATGSLPPKAMPLIQKATLHPESTAEILLDVVRVLTKSDDREALNFMLAALNRLTTIKDAGKQLEAARRDFFNAPKLENHHLALEQIAAVKPDTLDGHHAAMAVLSLASRKGGSPESREMSRKAIDQGWSDPKQKLAFIKAATELGNPIINDKIGIALSDPDATIAKAASEAAKRLKIQAPGEDKTPKISTLEVPDAIKRVTSHQGDVALGQAVFTRATCIACHTVSQDQKQKGPYLGNITETYRRNELAEAILVPHKTIAQGFATNVFTLKNGTFLAGFVTNEAGDSVTIRDITSQEHTFKKSEIKERSTLTTSLMPEGLMLPFTVHEMASLLDYLESLKQE